MSAVYLLRCLRRFRDGRPVVLAGAGSAALSLPGRVLFLLWLAVGTAALLSTLGLCVTVRVSVVIAARVVAGRRSFRFLRRPVVLDVGSVGRSGAATVGSYTGHPSLSRRMPGRWGNGNARARARAGLGLGGVRR
jgi:hypothetical protein